MSRNLKELETEMLFAVADNDRRAFAWLFHSFHQELGNYVYRLTKSRTIAEEIVQDTFVKVWLNREELRQVRSFRAYLFTISRNHAFNTLRSETKRVFLSEDTIPEILLSEESADSHEQKEELYGIVEKAVVQLPPQQQKVWRMNKEEGLSYQKIAESLELSPQTVKRHISLAMASILRYVKVNGSTFFALTFLVAKQSL